MPPPQLGRRVQELRPRRADDEDGDVGEPVHEVIHEVEESVVGPVQGPENEYERVLLRKRLEEPPPCRECLTAAVPARVVHCEADERPQMGFEPNHLRGVG